MRVCPSEGTDSAIDGVDRRELGQDGSKRGETVALEVRAAVGRPGEGAPLGSMPRVARSGLSSQELTWCLNPTGTCVISMAGFRQRAVSAPMRGATMLVTRCSTGSPAEIKIAD